MTFENLRLQEDEDEDETGVDRMDVTGKLSSVLAGDAHRRVVHEVRSMAVPIINTPQEPWAPLDEDLGGDDPDSDVDVESDDDGDLFQESYVTGSFPDGRPAPVIPPTAASNNGAADDVNVEGADPEDEAPAIEASMPIVPAQDDQMESDADDL